MIEFARYIFCPRYLLRSICAQDQESHGVWQMIVYTYIVRSRQQRVWLVHECPLCGWRRCMRDAQGATVRVEMLSAF